MYLAIQRSIHVSCRSVLIKPSCIEPSLRKCAITARWVDIAAHNVGLGYCVYYDTMVGTEMGRFQRTQMHRCQRYIAQIFRGLCPEPPYWGWLYVVHPRRHANLATL